GGGHRFGSWKILFVLEIAARVVICHGAATEEGRAHPARVGARLPGVAFVAAFVLPGGEIGVVVFAAHFEEMGMVRDEHRWDAGLFEVARDRVLPYFDGTPRLPEEVERAAEDVVPGGHARERTGVMLLEAQRARGEGIEIGRREFVAAVGAEHVPVEAIEEDDDGVLGTRWWRGGGLGHGGSLAPGSGAWSAAC